jgi:cbb3-type cytochrome oxidase maturation protein
VTILYVLVPLGLALALLALSAFFWAVDAGQFEDLDDAAGAPLRDD